MGDQITLYLNGVTSVAIYREEDPASPATG